MTHLWVRAEQRPNEARAGITPEGVRALTRAGIRVTVEHSSTRAPSLTGYGEAGAEIAPENSWPGAPADAIIFGLKELPGTARRCATATSCSATPTRGSVRAARCWKGSGPEAGCFTISNTSWTRPAAASPPSATGPGSRGRRCP